MPRTLVTGAGGFIGSSAIAASAARGPVCALVRNRRPPLTRGVDVADWDGSPEGLVSVFETFAPTRVIHLAARYRREHEIGDVPSMIEANVGFTAMVLEAAWRTSAPCIAIAHSSFQHFGERDRALDLYAATKLAAIEIARYYADAHAVSWVGVTLYDVYGPGMTRDTLVTSALKAAAGGPPLATPAEDPVIGLVYVDDAVAAMHAAAESVESGAAPVGTEFFALPMSFLRISEVIDAVERVTGSRVARSDRPYPTPQRAVDRPTIGDPPPGWSATVDLDEGLRRLLAVEG